MAEFKFAVGNPGTKKTYKIEKKDSEAQPFFGMKVGQEFNGELLGLNGYKLKITGEKIRKQLSTLIYLNRKIIPNYILEQRKEYS